MFESVDELPGDHQVVYLSPHLDDAVFSAGGAIAAAVHAGRKVLIATVCTGEPRSITAYAAALHERWRVPQGEVVAVRLAEDQQALASLGVDGVWLGFLDAIYRVPAAYHSRAQLFGPLGGTDTLVGDLERGLVALYQRCPGAVVYAPLGVGAHVDHHSVHLAARRLQQCGATVVYYEDLPYAFQPGAVEVHLQGLGLVNTSHVELVDITRYLTAKLAASAYYDTQVNDNPGLLAAIRSHAFSISQDGAAVERVRHMPPTVDAAST